MPASDDREEREAAEKRHVGRVAVRDQVQEAEQAEPHEERMPRQAEARRAASGRRERCCRGSAAPDPTPSG
jgi:hypothetical protein